MATTRKLGVERWPNGRIKQKPKGPDLGSERVQARRAYYSNGGRDADYSCDALGRAHLCELLGEFSKGKVQLGRRFAADYREFFEQHPIADSFLRIERGRGGGGRTVINLDPMRERENLVREAEFNQKMKRIRGLGSNVWRAFFALVVLDSPDHGPAWLDRIIERKKAGLQLQPSDKTMLRDALKGLGALLF